YKLLNNDEVKALFDGCLVTVGTETYGFWNMYNFRPDGNFTTAGGFIKGGTEFLPNTNKFRQNDRPWSCENGIVTLNIDNTGTKDAASYQVRMLKEGYYILNVAGNDIPTHLLIQANEDGTFAYSYK
ncbi:MAG: hypothetical protein U0L11_08250, partial [Acutalibacteraceae bacterium]|nr:hypothetical protein [Acutalibacteraceae bacterium]